MKIVLQTPPATEFTTLDKFNVDRVYVALDKKDKNTAWIMRFEPERTPSPGGYIFRYWDATATGMSGWFPTAQKCIERAFEFATVYECNSYAEAFQLIKKTQLCGGL